MSVTKKVEVPRASCDKGIIIPEVVRKRLGVLLNKDDEIDEIYSKLSYLFCPEASNSVWSKTGIIRKINRSGAYVLDRYFIKTEKNSSSNFNCSNTKDKHVNIEETKVNPPSKSIICSKNKVESPGNIEGCEDGSSSNSGTCSNNEAGSSMNVKRTKDGSLSNLGTCSNNEAGPPVNVKGTKDGSSSNSSTCSNNEAGPPVNVEVTKDGSSSNSNICSNNEAGPPVTVEGTKDGSSSNSSTCSNNEAEPPENVEGIKDNSLSNSINCSNYEEKPSRNLKSPNRKEIKVQHRYKPNVFDSEILDISDATQIVNEIASTSYTNDEEHTRTIESDDLVNESDNSCQNKNKSQVEGFEIVEQLKSKIRKKLSTSVDSEITRKREHRRTIHYNVGNHSLLSEGDSLNNSTATDHLNSPSSVNIDPNDPEISPSKHLRIGGSNESNLSSSHEASLPHVQRKSPKKRKSSKQNKFDESHDVFNFDTNSEKLTSKLVQVRDVAEDVDVDPLYTSDINPEDDLFLVQCPCEINPNDLTGKVISLLGSSLLTVTTNEKVEKYDCVTVKSDSLLNLLLPTRDHSAIKLGMYPSSGKVILSQGGEGGGDGLPSGSFTSRAEPPQGGRVQQQLPHGPPLAESTLLPREAADLRSDNPEFPQDEPNGRPLAESTLLPREAADLRSDLSQNEPCDVDPVDDECLTESIEDPVTKKRKKKKKRKGDDHMRDDGCLTSFTESFEDSTVTKKKKKKHKGDEHTADDECLTTFTEPFEDAGIQKRKKKKKKKHKGDECSMDDECTTSFTESTEDPDLKKRKKEKVPQGDEYSMDDEFPTSFTSSIEDTPKKKRKKKNKHKDNEQSIEDGCLTSLTESTEDHVTEKRKKKKRHSGEEQMKDECLISFTEPIEDPLNKQNKEKGPKGDVQTLESDSSFTLKSENPGKKKKKKKSKLNLLNQLNLCKSVSEQDNFIH